VGYHISSVVISRPSGSTQTGGAAIPSRTAATCQPQDSRCPERGGENSGIVDTFANEVTICHNTLISIPSRKKSDD